MSIPESLRGLTTDPAFWAAYLPPAGEPVPGHHAELRVSVPVAGGYGLVLEIDLAYGECHLGLRQPGATEPLPLARTDPGRPYPTVLRWAELNLIGQLLALDDPQWRHPGLLVALLHRYASADDQVAADQVAADRMAAPDRPATMLATALRGLSRSADPEPEQMPAAGPDQPPLALFDDPRWWPTPVADDPRIFDDDAVARQVGDHLAHTGGVHWRYAAGWGWVAAGPADGGGTPLRTLGAESFPFDDVAELVRRAAARHRRLLDAPWRRAPRIAPLLQRVRESGDPAAVPALGRALADAGCDHPTLLDALTAPVVPAEAAWVVDALSGIVPADDDGR
ncbi:hypothetical protein O7608_04900 [Solwaraspora sp. WMMA2056]|uniref:hypothetical protein n=1 Tax=Solwaraspora sp. WMMA2056 TaxID=3015161 RepID=UPI00259B0E84|nr:hypothetical protein [Solwaraspora sp. WMMA2056]WJK41759.1 hypothetical protein O7608_04900 [Solwaraspora sp. WMMA2056]